MVDEERIVYMKWKIITWETSREIFSETDKTLRIHSNCLIDFCEEFPELVWKEIVCKQFFLFPERYIELKIWNPVQIILPYYRVDEYLQQDKKDLQVYDIEIDVHRMMNE